MFTPHHVSCVTCHMSHVTCHMSHVTCPVSHVNLFFIFFLGQSGAAYRWRVCYQRGLPRLVYNLNDFMIKKLIRRDIEGLLIEPRQRQQTTMANHNIPQADTKCLRKSSVVPPTCQHLFCTSYALVLPPNLSTLCPHVLAPKPCPVYLLLHLPLQKSALPAGINRSKVQSVLDIPNWKSKPL